VTIACPIIRSIRYFFVNFLLYMFVNIAPIECKVYDVRIVFISNWSARVQHIYSAILINSTIACSQNCVYTRHLFWFRNGTRTVCCERSWVQMHFAVHKYCTVRRPLDKMHQHLIRGRRLTAKRTRQFSCFCLFLSCPIPLFIYFYFVMRSSKFHCRMACRFHLFKELYRFFFLFLRRVFF
jgi:hypothetical protein